MLSKCQLLRVSKVFYAFLLDVISIINVCLYGGGGQVSRWSPGAFSADGCGPRSALGRVDICLGRGDQALPKAA